MLHPLTDDRRILPLDRTGETLRRAAEFHARVVLQSRLPERAQVAEAEHAPALRRPRIRLPAGGGGSRDRGGARAASARNAAAPLVLLAHRLRALDDVDLEEGCSTRLVVYAATLIAGGMRVEDAVRAAMIEPLTDDAEVKKGLVEVARAILG